jgi:Tfp pilus assembly ATPase PilU
VLTVGAAGSGRIATLESLLDHRIVNTGGLMFTEQDAIA